MSVRSFFCCRNRGNITLSPVELNGQSGFNGSSSHSKAAKVSSQNRAHEFGDTLNKAAANCEREKGAGAVMICRVVASE